MEPTTQPVAPRSNLGILIVILVAALITGGMYMYFQNQRIALEQMNVIATEQIQQPVTETPAPTTGTSTASAGKQSLPETCTDEAEGTPVITSFSTYSPTLGSKIEIKGCNFAGFEGDKTAWIEDMNGVKGIMYSEPGATAKSMTVVLKPTLCQEDNSYSGKPCEKELMLKPGRYAIYTNPWGKMSNKVYVMIQ